MADREPQNPKPDETWISEDDSAAPFEPAPSRLDSGEFDTAPPTEGAPYIPVSAFGELREGSTVPGYKILGQIGKGGMGAVFLAEQQRPKRTVALKVIRADRVTEATRRRFEYEAQILARLKHPGIAQIYEVGSFNLGDGQTPYFAMEYIQGAKPLTNYAKEHDLSTRTRLELFAQVCDAVHHGHQKGIIHRDLKPVNILVDDTGAPRIIDFGIARANDEENVLATMQTNAGQILGTLQYMSPEQCGGASDTVDVRADVYALGVILFQLLSGELPYDLSTLGFAEALLVVTQDRAPSLASIHAHFKGDLAVICAKALDKDKNDRYQSASELAADIRRYLEDRPILARPIGPLGLLVKWTRRNRELATAITAAAAVLTITSAVLITRIIIAERKATANFNLANENLITANENLAASRDSVELMRNLFQFQHADGTSLLKGGMIRVDEFLNVARDGIAANPPERIATEADFRELIGVGYISARGLEDARAELERVLEIRNQERPPQPAELASAMHNLARVYYFSADYHRAEDLYNGAVERRRTLARGADDAELATSITHLAATKWKLGNLDEAQSLFEESLAMRQRLFGDRDPDIAASLNNLGNLLVTRANYVQAEGYLRRSLEMITRIRSEDPNAVEISYAAHNLAKCLVHLGKYEEAEQLYRQALAIRTMRLSPTHPSIAVTRLGLAEVLHRQNRPIDAEAFARDAVSQFAATYSTEHDELNEARQILAEVLAAQGRHAEAAPFLADCVAATRAMNPVPSEQLAERLLLQGRCFRALDANDEAEAVLAEGIQLATSLTSDDLHRQLGRELLDLYQSLGRTDEADALAVRLNSP